MPTWLNIVIIALIVLFLVKRIMPVKGVKSISTTDLKGLLKDVNKQFIDVRTPGEFKAKHIREFQNMPLNTLGQQAQQVLSKDKEVIVICQSGMRSSQASKLLKKMGFEKVTNVRGGMSAWL
ncbi:rhodanese-like domain-containing protein [Pullulanibacillus sp. KACC 23026]|uniref:rhodanese-like domain-containing protein n=1 Tax=Pullulanibacillus sp. KACC 23026 TaxID=3028315 RepID=UPI0023AEDCE8|nr:rhodanese-like domain-containing protein [Pullulanibacillus sp. KACC 23026]WEG12125.1 rhodanese-like domain-containing protein [Pullulanibacillus sp. KACC 23026]